MTKEKMNEAQTKYKVLMRAVKDTNKLCVIGHIDDIEEFKRSLTGITIQQRVVPWKGNYALKCHFTVLKHWKPFESQLRM